MLVAQQHGATTTRYLQDLAAPLPQVLRQSQGSQTTDYLYGMERLASVQGTTRIWYGTDALGSVRQTLDNTGQPLTTLNYDPWGMPEGGTVPPTFGFTGELQEAASSSVYLRARWYQPSQGALVGRDPFAGFADKPFTLHPYQYGANNPISNGDPSGLLCNMFMAWWNGDPTCDWVWNTDTGGKSYLEASLEDAPEGISGQIGYVFAGMGAPGAMVGDYFTGGNATSTIYEKGGVAAYAGTGITLVVGGAAAYQYGGAAFIRGQAFLMSEAGAGTALLLEHVGTAAAGWAGAEALRQAVLCDDPTLLAMLVAPTAFGFPAWSSKAPDEIVAEPYAPKKMTNQEVRQWYNERVSIVDDLNQKWIDEGYSLKTRARAAWRWRHRARLEARTMMADPEEVRLLQQRDLAEYGNPDGPTFEQLVEKAQSKGYTGDEIYEYIIGSSRRTNAEVNKRFNSGGQ